MTTGDRYTDRNGCEWAVAGSWNGPSGVVLAVRSPAGLRWVPAAAVARRAAAGEPLADYSW